MRFYGEKRLEFYKEFISKFIPQNINEFVYVEPFGGTFNVNKFLHLRPLKSIYNDFNDYSFKIECDEEYHLDYKEIFKMFDSEKTVFYLDPPYYGSEQMYLNCVRNDKKFHYELCENIKKLKGKVILSYSDNSYIRYLYEDFDIFRYDGKRNTYKNEIIITKN